MPALAAKSDEPIPGYHVKHRLGAGGYGEVWTVEAPGQLLKAIKFVYGMLDEDRAARELKALNRIKGVRHPFLLSLERIEVVDGHLLIVTELADGSLKDRYEECRKKGVPGIDRDELLQHLSDAADALDYMNERHSLQHLDVKPENLLLVGGRIKVADFGLVKDIQDVTASLMGGLTPVYAPPEVFEGNPSRRSDQYSLAIVYQEMLTSVLPFPGKSAAQLAAQHLNAKPRLNSLPAADQLIIGRALAKKPAERFNSCRELVRALESAGRLPTTTAAPLATSAPPPLAVGSMLATEAGTPARPAPLETERPRTPGDMLRELEAASQAADGELNSAVAAHGACELLLPPPACIDAPPPAVGGRQFAQQPTLYLGVGGAAGRVLQGLRRRIVDRNDVNLICRSHMLLVDSDGRDLLRATHGEDGAALSTNETLHIPLRRTQDYRSEAGKSYEWLSRRWLYNIPRSLQTEGLRPLGRLAFVDHATELKSRLQAGLQSLIEQEAEQAAQQQRPPLPPRVVLIASLSGGTGSGAAVDTAYLVRQTLDELHCDQGSVVAVFAHSTNRSPQTQDLAAVNSFAALSELNQFHRPAGVYPGDFGCGIRSREGGALAAAYVVHLGQELSPEAFAAACDRVAEFLLLDAATGVGPLLEGCRSLKSEEQAASGEFRVRSFGLSRAGLGQDPLVDRTVARVCRGLLERWIGMPKPVSVKKSTHLPLGEKIESTSDSLSAKDIQLDNIAATHAAQLGLEVDKLLQRMHLAASQELENSPDQCFRSIAAAFPCGADGTPPIQKWLSACTELFGSGRDAEGPARISSLQENLETHARTQAAALAPAAKQWVEALVEHPSARLYGAQRMCKWLMTHLKSQADKLRSTRTEIIREWTALEQQIVALGRVDGGRKRPAGAAADTVLLQLCRTRLIDLAAAAAATLVQALVGHLLAVQDGLQDLTRSVRGMHNQFHVEADEAVPSDDDLLGALKLSASQHLKASEEELAARLDDSLAAAYINPQGGLQQTLLRGDQTEALLEKMHLLARTAVLSRLEQLDLPAMLFGAADPTKLQALLAEAQPKLQTCGGERRLICLLPTSSKISPEHMRRTLAGGKVFRQAAAVVRDASSDLVFCFELGPTSISHVAAEIINHRPELMECAERIYTRADVDWHPLLRLK